MTFPEIHISVDSTPVTGMEDSTEGTRIVSLDPDYVDGSIINYKPGPIDVQVTDDGHTYRPDEEYWAEINKDGLSSQDEIFKREEEISGGIKIELKEIPEDLEDPLARESKNLPLKASAMPI